MKDITGAEVSVWNLESECILSTGDVEEREQEIVLEYMQSFYLEERMEEQEIYGIDEHMTVDGIQLRMVYEEEMPCYILSFQGLDGDVEVVTALCVNQLEHLLAAYKEKVSKSGFLRNLLRGMTEEEEISSKSERVNIKNKARRVVFAIETTKKNDDMVFQTLKSLSSTGITDFVVEVEIGLVVFVKELNTTAGEVEIHKMARILVDTLNMEAMVPVLVGYGTVVEDLLGVQRSYYEARMAIDVGKTFDGMKTVFAYRQLGIGRLVHQLTDELCEEFLQEVLGEGGMAQFDADTMQAAYKFFENDLNISRTARELYVHRNTLSYRLEKIQMQTGLDIRNFEDAITFKMAIMVSSHMEFVGGNKKSCK